MTDGPATGFCHICTGTVVCDEHCCKPTSRQEQHVLRSAWSRRVGLLNFVLVVALQIALTLTWIRRRAESPRLLAQSPPMVVWYLPCFHPSPSGWVLVADILLNLQHPESEHGGYPLALFLSLEVWSRVVRRVEFLRRWLASSPGADATLPSARWCTALRVWCPCLTGPRAPLACLLICQNIQTITCSMI